MNSSNDAIISQLLDGTITTWNPGATLLYGYAVAEALGHNIEMLIPEEHRDNERAVLVRAAEGEWIKEYETVRVRADGSLIHIARSASPVFDSTGRVVGVSTIVHDISERIQAATERAALEERLNQSQRLESLGQLAGGIAHDFNNLLAVILNYASFVAEEITDNEAASADVEQIRIAVNAKTAWLYVPEDKMVYVQDSKRVFSSGQAIRFFADMKGRVQNQLCRSGSGSGRELSARAGPERRA